MILPKSFYNQSALKVAQELLGCFLVREIDLSLTLSLVRRGKSLNNLPLTPPLIRKGGVKSIMRFKIVETEAYNGPNDLASHASRGRTGRNKVMFEEPGIIYVYFTYGMHYMLNIVTGPKDYPAAVLIRAVETPHPNPPLSKGREILDIIKNMSYKTNGPARLTKALQIDKSFNGLPIYVKKYGFWLESRKEAIKSGQIKKTTRIGVDYAGKYRDKKWRFYIKDSKFISKK